MGTGSFYPHTFDSAETYLAAGRSKHDRPLGSNTRLIRRGPDRIAVRYHQTDVVTYHRDGMVTITGGGWNTVTTKQRISEYSPARPGSDGNGRWIVGYTAEVTPPRVQKCRTCKHRGTWLEDDECYGPTRWDNYCYPARGAACEHGKTDGHHLAPCSHGEWKRHVTGQVERSCYRCSGTGMADYGSKKVPITVDAADVWQVDAAGTFLGVLKSAPGGPSASVGTSYGSGVLSELRAVVPGLDAMVRHPVTDATKSISSIIVDLNDVCGWSRPRIADWLETLDADLSFPAAA